MNTRFLIAALVFPVLFACVPKAQTVILKPAPAVEAGNMGKGIRVLVVTTDDRASGVLGSQGATANATVSTDQNAAAVLEAQVVDGLRKKGFDAVTKTEAGVATSSRTLTVSLETLNYAAAGNAFSGDVHLKAAITAVATTGGAPLERTYRGEEDRKVGLSPTADANTRYVNEILSDVLSRLLNDERLLNFLAH